MKKNFFGILLVMVLLFTLLPHHALAAEIAEDSSEVITLENGNYIVVTTEEFGTRATQTKSGSKKYTYSNNSGEVEWVITLSGTFTYTGTTSTCTASSVDVTINASKWYVVSESASKSGSTATANVTMGRKFLGITVEKLDNNLTLTCDKNGNLS